MFVATGAAGRGPRCRCASDAHWQEPTALRFSLRLARDQPHALHPNITHFLDTSEMIGSWDSGLDTRATALGPVIRTWYDGVEAPIKRRAWRVFCAALRG